MAFNELTRVYEEEELRWTRTMEEVGKGEGEYGAAWKSAAWLVGFKRRGSVLGAQQGELEGLARECLGEIGKYED